MSNLAHSQAQVFLYLPILPNPIPKPTALLFSLPLFPVSSDTM